MNIHNIKAIRRCCDRFHSDPVSYAKGCFFWANNSISILLSLGTRTEIHVHRSNPDELFSCVFIYDHDKKRGFFQEMFADDPVTCLDDDYDHIVGSAVGKLIFDMWIENVLDILPYFGNQIK